MASNVIGSKKLLAGVSFVALIFVISFYHGSRQEVCMVTPEKTNIVSPDHSNHVTPKHYPTVYIFKEYDLYLHSAFIDDRRLKPVVRIFGLHNRTKLAKEFHCHFVKSNGLDEEVKATIYSIDRSWPDWSPYFAVELDCELPKSIKLDSVTISSKRGTSASIPISSTKSTTNRKEIAVCVKPITGELNIARLVEWFEMFRATGVEDFVMYLTHLSGNAQHVLDYYKDEGILDIVKFPFLSSTLANIEDKKPLTGEERYATYQQTYLVAMHNCFYRYRKMYRHLLFIDIDEIITPPYGTTIQEILGQVAKVYTSAASYLFLTSWHFEEHGETKSNHPAPYLYMQRYLTCTSPIDNQPKGITVVDRTITVNFHTAVDVYKKGYSNEILPWEKYGYLHHYRGKCKDKFPPDRCKDLLKDKRVDKLIPKYKYTVQKQVKKVLETLLMNPELLKT